MDQQMEIDSLQSQLAEINKRLSELESTQGNNEQFEERLNTLEKINQIDEGSIHNYISELPQLLSGQIFGVMYSDINCYDPLKGSYYCTPPVQKEILKVNWLGLLQYIELYK